MKLSTTKARSCKPKNLMCFCMLSSAQPYAHASSLTPHYVLVCITRQCSDSLVQLYRLLDDDPRASLDTF